MKLFYNIALFAMLFFTSHCAFAQRWLDRVVSVDVKKKPIKSVFNIIESGGGFSFSYTGALVPEDSLVSIYAKNKSVRQVLQMMFGERYQYQEIGNHIIIQPAEREKWYTISGNVRDANTGLGIMDASVIEPHQLASTLTNQDGHFRLRLKDKGRYESVSLTVSMGTFYKDTTFVMPWGDQDLLVSLSPSAIMLPDVPITSDMERSRLGKFLLSAQLRKQSANLGKFFVDKPVQASVIPGIGTHGKLSGHVANKFSFNLLGGYAAGVNGLEIGGLFNIDKKSVKYVQVGGVFNIVTDSVEGVQIGGVTNEVLKSFDGVQLSGVSGAVGGDLRGVAIAGVLSRVGRMKGVQVAGVLNLLTKRDTIANDTVYGMTGFQVAGIANIVNNDSRGMQLAGILNISRGGVKGMQLSGICNIARKMEGSQVGVINIADTVSGYCIGIINIVRKGYHTFAVSASDLATVNLEYKSGNKKLYSILKVCGNLGGDVERYGYGYGIGTERKISNKTGLAGELSMTSVYENGRNVPFLVRTDVLFNWNITKKFTLFTGAALSFVPSVSVAKHGKLPEAPAPALYDFSVLNNDLWVGWQVGFHIF
jgi:hypothetical protein